MMARPVSHASWSRRTMAALALITAAAAASGCMLRGEVVRVMDGRLVSGRYIDANAYAAFFAGAIAEQDGDLEAAEALYRQAANADPDGAGPRLRLGAVRCKLRPLQPEAWLPAFARAAQLEPELADVYSERARCLLQTQALRGAHRDAQRAFELAPGDAEISLLLADVLEARGDTQQARRILAGLVVWAPGSPSAWAKLGALEEKVGEPFLAWAHRRVLAPSGQWPVTGAAQSTVLEVLDAALVQGDLKRARRAATRARVDAGGLAVRAAALGRLDLAREQAMMALDAEPTNGDALAAMATCCAGIDDRLPWPRSATSSRVSALGALLLARTLQQQLGEDPARAFMDAYGPIDAVHDDPLAERLLRQLTTPAGP